MSTYVCSDIHGSYDYLKRMLKLIKFNANDTLYILGDVLDKGLWPFEIIDFCMNNDNVKLLMGNHELMFYRAYTELGEEFLWFNNGGLYTSQKYEALPYTMQNDIFEYIQNLPVVIKNVSVEGKNFYLSHASYYPYTYPDKNEMTLFDIGLITANRLLWKRDYPFVDIKKSDIFLDNKNSILISGHTAGIKLYERKIKKTYTGKAFILHDCKGHYINTDCGLAYRYAIDKPFTPRLGFLRLDDMKEYYV